MNRATSSPARLALGCLLLLACHAHAQSPPRIGYVRPAGGRHGETLRVTVGGQSLTGVTNVHVSGTGVRATVLEHARPLTPREFGLLRDKLKELQERRAATRREAPPAQALTAANAPPATAWTTDEDRMLAEIRKKLANPPNRQRNPAIAETAILEITTAPDAKLGARELRLATPAGLSNPLAFHVGQLPEVNEQETQQNAADRETRVQLPTTVNGRIMPGDIDRFRFVAPKGMQLVVAAKARALIPYLPDAVPGWFQAVLTLRDSSGNERAYVDDFRFDPDPVLSFQIPEDGEYTVEIRDALYRGREDFVYRLSLGALPCVTHVFPLGGPAGHPGNIEVRGWNLPSTPFAPGPERSRPGISLLQVGNEDSSLNPALFALDTLPEVFDAEPNDQATSAQPLTPPTIVNGRVDQPGDSDLFQFHGRAGETLVAEVLARRLNSPLDSLLRLTDAAGRVLQSNDDSDDKGAGLTTHHADSYLTFALPADGRYYLHLGDTQHRGGDEYAYRLRVGPPRPDFELRAVPSTLNTRPGTSVPITIYAIRKDGFAGEIALRLRNAPTGFRLDGPRVPAQVDEVRVTLTLPPQSAGQVLSLSLEGHARIQGHDVRHPAVPADDRMQAFSFRHLVPAQELLVAIAQRGSPRAAAILLSRGPVRIPIGGTATVRVAIPSPARPNPIQLELSDPPQGLAIEKTLSSRESTEIVLHTDTTAKPGLQGNLIVAAYRGQTGVAARPSGPRNPRRTPVGVLPAIPFEIVPATTPLSP